MARMNIVLPAMGEGVIEATINKWLVKTGDVVKEDDPLVEVATDKVDSEVPAPASGVIVEIKAAEGSVPAVGDIIAILDTEIETTPEVVKKIDEEVEMTRETVKSDREERQEEYMVSREMKSRTRSGKFLSPLVRNIAAQEGISYPELDTITGTGMDGRITRDDILRFLESRKKETIEEDPKQPETAVTQIPESPRQSPEAVKTESSEIPNIVPPKEEIIEMDRVRKLIADHMVMSVRTSPHAVSFIDADVTKMIRWRSSIKDRFLADEGQKLTLTPIFVDAAARALHDFPMVNISVDGYNIIRKKNINIGIATALPDGNLIVPVIKNANEKNLTGLAKAVNDLSERARSNKLKPDEITGGTFTITNFGTFNNLSGVPIINQPQVAILGTGAVRKMPAVIEAPDGDMIAIRHIMILSLSFDHRVIDGALAGKFLSRIKEILEDYTPDIA
ncbi:MAG: dihydrolipoamide acetyltransferase family protein [Bacteroidota bacterium]|nr:dihydrolipoamide acetyltransferase family protein [Bacteroidota bacterium]